MSPLAEKLMAFLGDGPERVGFVLKAGTIVEVKNVCHDPENGFEVSGEDIVKYEDAAVATWHTHPGEAYTSNLTTADHYSYLAYPDLRHYIIGRDGVTCYVVEGGKVLVASSDLSPRQTEETSPRPD